MANNTGTLLLSGGASILIYLLLIFFLLFRYLEYQKEEEKKTLPSKIEEKKVEVEKDQVESSKTPIAGTGIKSLFSEVETKIPVKNEQEESSNDDELARRIKSIKPKQKIEKESKVDKIVQNLSLSSTLSFAKTDGEYNEYYSKVQELLGKFWRPKSYSQNLESKVIITIDNNGKFYFSIKKKSTNDEFDQELLAALQQMEGIDFPPFSGGKKTDIEVTFKTEEN